MLAHSLEISLHTSGALLSKVWPRLHDLPTRFKLAMHHSSSSPPILHAPAPPLSFQVWGPARSWLLLQLWFQPDRAQQWCPCAVDKGEERLAMLTACDERVEAESSYWQRCRLCL